MNNPGLFATISRMDGGLLDLLEHEGVSHLQLMHGDDMRLDFCDFFIGHDLKSGADNQGDLSLK